jgi:hypothetical protein
MKLVKVKVKLPKRTCIDPEYLTRPTPFGMPKLNFLAVLYGSMGSGKSVALYNMIDMYDATKSYDRIVWYSPTMCRDVNGMDYLGRHHNFELCYYPEFKQHEFMEHLARFKSDIDDYREYKRKLEIWEKYAAHGYDVDAMTFEELMWLDEMEFEKPTTQFKWGFPSFAVVFDDCICERIFSQNIKNEVSKFFTTHRQASCCVYFTSQVHQQGVPRQIRGVISIWILFRCKSKDLQEAIAKELSFKCDKDTLMKVWDYVTKDDPHHFLFIDYKQNDLKDMFRRNFTEQVALDGIDMKEEKSNLTTNAKKTN